MTRVSVKDVQVDPCKCPSSGLGGFKTVGLVPSAANTYVNYIWMVLSPRRISLAEFRAPVHTAFLSNVSCASLHFVSRKTHLGVLRLTKNPQILGDTRRDAKSFTYKQGAPSCWGIKGTVGINHGCRMFGWNLKKVSTLVWSQFLRILPHPYTILLLPLSPLKQTFIYVFSRFLRNAK